ncbi:MAG: helix-turn-helix domain-containing protein [Acidimicrobiia bacterium]|nr:helix-turn-helix domain-containing protein [Acidimicrobiia bacterium]
MPRPTSTGTKSAPAARMTPPGLAPTNGPRRPHTLLIDDAARALGLSRRTVYYRIRDGRLAYIRTRCGSRRVIMPPPELWPACRRKKHTTDRATEATPTSEAEAQPFQVQALSGEAESLCRVVEPSAVFSQRGADHLTLEPRGGSAERPVEGDGHGVVVGRADDAPSADLGREHLGR